MARRASNTIIGAKRATSNTAGPAGLLRPTVTRTVRRSATGSVDAEAGIGIRKVPLRLLSHVVVARGPVGVHCHEERAEVPDAELPEALRHQVLPVDRLDRLDLDRLDAGRPTDDGQVDRA